MANDQVLGEGILSTLREDKRQEVEPLSKSRIEKALEQAGAERDAANAGEQHPVVAPTLRFL